MMLIHKIKLTRESRGDKKTPVNVNDVPKRHKPMNSTPTVTKNRSVIGEEYTAVNDDDGAEDKRQVTAVAFCLVRKTFLFSMQPSLLRNLDTLN